MLRNFKPTEEFDLAQLEIYTPVIGLQLISSEPVQHSHDGLLFDEGMFDNSNEMDIDWVYWLFLVGLFLSTQC